MDFTIADQELDARVHLIELSGEVDLYNAPAFKQRLVEAIESGKREVVIDLTDVSFIDSTTLGVLVGGLKRLRPEGGNLRLVCSNENIVKIFEITGLDRVFSLHETREAAIAEARGAGASNV